MALLILILKQWEEQQYFTGTRVPVQALFDCIETGETLNEFLENFPSVKKNYAIQVLEMARKSITTEKILNENFA